MASRSLGTLTLDLIARIGGFQQGMDQAARSTQRSMGQVVRHSESASESVTGSFKAIAGAAAAFLSVQQLVEYSQTWLGVQNRIKQVSETFDEFSKQSSAVFSIAQNSQSSLEATAELYQRIAASSGQLGATQEKVAQVTQNISKAMSASGVSAESAQAALVQLGQAFASGVLRGEELNSVLEQAPGLAQAIADGLGVARESLRSMGEAGKLTSKEVFSAILSQTRSIDDAFARSQTTVSGAFQVMENSAAKFFGTLDETLGITKSFVQTALSASAAWDASGVESFTQVLKTGLYVALARVAAGFVSATGAKYLDIKATQEQLYANSLATAGELRRAEAVKAGAVADVESAARAVANAKAKVTADRQVITSEVARLESVQAALAAEKLLEAQRLQAQISDVGRQQTIARMAELRLAEVAITNQLTAAEAKLATTTLATSAQVTAAINQQTVAKEALAVANTKVNATQIAATASMGAWFSASTAMGASMLTLRNAASGVLRMAAGWPGLILTVGALALSFIDFGDKAEEGAGKAANAFEDASARIRQASRSMLPKNLSTQSYEQLQDRLKGLQGELKETEKLQERFQKGVDDKSDVPFETSLDASKEKADALRLAIQSVQKELNSSRLASDKEGSTYLKNLEKQAVVAGKLTEVEKLRAQIAAGAVKFSPDDEKKALAAAEAIDKANKALKGSKAGDKDSKALSRRFEEMEEGYQRQIELINTSTDKRKNASEVEKLAFEVSTGKLEGVNAQQRKRLEGLAAELDALKKLKQAEEDAKKLASFRSSVNEDYLTAKNGFDQELAGAGRGDKYKERMKERLSIEEDFNRQQRELVLQRNSGDISQGLYDQETQVLSAALAERLELQNDYYSQLDEAQSNWMDGVTSAWENFADAATDYSAMAADATTSVLGSARSELGSFLSDVATGSKDAGDALMDMVGGFARSMVDALADMAAQWLVYQAVQLMVGKTTQASAVPTLIANAQATSFQAQLAAFASTAAIPIVGPALAPGAAIAAAMATAPLVAGVASSALVGMAHDGIDSVPREGTWLLQKGERVTTASTSAKLDKTLDEVNKGSRGGQPEGTGQPVAVHQVFHVNGDVSPQTVAMIQQGMRQTMSAILQDVGRNGQIMQSIRKKL
ncbi:phage tail tape measure protein [Pseudomonas sp. GD03817]|uniref:phage tail tape measure protein n=1 Tax=Pseudomonas TaxID=286 RepID=UPI000A93E96A|nr:MULTISPECIES: phage tail tape measure protein [Pseudomonas]MCE0961659.1 phage tail tape measure protein [Pseudomonas putida]MDD2119669.1 phage tail tape measure protein [Pseudomonas putida]MDH1403851.1 phage tail tape measure protein [Pseudomonas sp. GD03730]MDH1775884.1 phage tail tape measure protein [Pseudomonas sp. GD03817]UPU90557.1 phage tail tape measure protein [Pseudomonas putida]